MTYKTDVNVQIILINFYQSWVSTEIGYLATFIKRKISSKNTADTSLHIFFKNPIDTSLHSLLCKLVATSSHIYIECAKEMNIPWKEIYSEFWKQNKQVYLRAASLDLYYSFY